MPFATLSVTEMWAWPASTSETWSPVTARSVSSATVSGPTRVVFTGASLTAVTLTVIVFALWSRSTPPLAVPPSSCTWKVKLA